MKTLISAAALAAVLSLSGAAFAQVPTGGADAKGNAPLKAPHTVNDGGAKRGATSFTEGEARKHIAHAGYADVSPLEKGEDGVWRGSATKNGAAVKVGLDFKGNIVEAGPAVEGVATGVSRSRSHAATTAGVATTTSTAETSGAPIASTSSESATVRHHRHGRGHHHRRHVHAACADPAPNGAACSGVDRNRNGVSDREDRAIKAGAKP